MRRVAIALVAGVVAMLAPGCGPTEPEHATTDTVSVIEDRCWSLDNTTGIHVSIACPNGGEVYRIGDTVTIRRCTADPVAYSLVDAPTSLSLDDGRSWEVIYPEMDATGSVGRWVVPESIDVFDFATGELTERSTVSEQCRMRVAVYRSDNDLDISDDAFRIVKQSGQ